MQGSSIIGTPYYFSFFFLLSSSMAAGMNGSPSDVQGALAFVQLKNEVEESASIVSASSQASSPEHPSSITHDEAFEPRKAMQEDAPIVNDEEERQKLEEELKCVRNAPGLINAAIHAGLVATPFRNHATLHILLSEFFDDEEITNRALHSLIPHIQRIIIEQEPRTKNDSGVSEHLMMVERILGSFITQIETHAPEESSKRIKWDDALLIVKQHQARASNALSRRSPFVAK